MSDINSEDSSSLSKSDIEHSDRTRGDDLFTNENKHSDDDNKSDPLNTITAADDKKDQSTKKKRSIIERGSSSSSSCDETDNHKRKKLKTVDNDVFKETRKSEINNSPNSSLSSAVQQTDQIKMTIEVESEYDDSNITDNNQIFNRQHYESCYVILNRTEFNNQEKTVENISNKSIKYGTDIEEKLENQNSSNTLDETREKVATPNNKKEFEIPRNGDNSSDESEITDELEEDEKDKSLEENESFRKSAGRKVNKESSENKSMKNEVRTPLSNKENESDSSFEKGKTATDKIQMKNEKNQYSSDEENTDDENDSNKINREDKVSKKYAKVKDEDPETSDEESGKSSDLLSGNNDSPRLKKKKLMKKSDRNSISDHSEVNQGANSSDSEDSDNENTDDKKQAKLKKNIPPEEDKRIIGLKKYLFQAGIRVNNFNKFWENCKSNRQRAQKLLDLLHEKGLKGRPSKEKCRKLRAKLETEREVAELDVNNIVDLDGKASRCTRTAYRSVNTQLSSSRSDDEKKTTSINRLQRIRAIVDSDSD